MSIALSAKVDTLERRVAALEERLGSQSDSLIRALDGWERALRRLDDLERTAARKPGPKPKDAA